MEKEKQITWFGLMWKNFYIQLFVLAIIFLAALIYYKDTMASGFAFYAALSIPVAMMAIIAYEGFYKYWNYIKNNNKNSK